MPREVSRPAPEPPPAAAVPPAAPAASSCLADLAALTGTRIRPAPRPEKEDPACHVAEPVILEALGTSEPGGVVMLEPPPVLDCAMAKAVATWVDLSVKPMTRGYFGAELTALRVGGGQECRRRNGGATGPLSEHAGGKALDIFAFRVGSPPDLRDISVEKPGSALASRFLDGIRQSACGAFATALGPGSDAAHATHLHVDIQDRRSRASRFCQ